MNLIENFLNNSSFFLLLCAMLFYWIRAFFNISFFSYSGKLAIIGANLTMLFLLIYRGLGANHFPLSNHAIKKEYHSSLRDTDILAKANTSNTSLAPSIALESLGKGGQNVSSPRLARQWASKRIGWRSPEGKGNAIF